MNEIFVYALYALFALACLVHLSFAEWILHFKLMHKARSWCSYPFKTHAITHHGLFKADATYHIQQHTEAHEHGDKITMAWWNAPIITFIPVIPFLLLAWATSIWPLFWIAYVCSWLYYATYEFIHYCMHLPKLPKPRLIERMPLYIWLNGHHLLHHRFMHKNFNVVFPFADWCLGTLVRRSHVEFEQPRGPAVPDVQPVRKVS